MQRRNVKARMVKSIGWENEIMEVEYISGLIHQYKDVSEADYIRSLTGAIDKKVRRIGKTHPFTRISE
ncbi:TPA: hypothetical protein ACGO0P_001470 [Streptococcus suis]